MKQLILSTTLFFLFLGIAKAQVDTTQFREPSNYSTAIDYFRSSLKKNPLSLYYTYQLACYNSLSDKKDSAFFYLFKAVERGAIAENIFTDTDFNSIHSDNSWQFLTDTLKAQYLKSYPTITQPELSVSLWLMGIEDQRYRTLSKNYKLKNRIIETPDMWEKRVNFVMNIAKTNGWPTISMVGEKAAESAFLIIQHAYLNDIKKILPLLIDAANRGEAKRSHAAMMIDRCLSMSDDIQIYGTQFHSEGKMNKSTGKVEWGVMTFYPIADEENVDSRRSSVGMSNFEEYCKGFKVKYEKPNDRVDYKHIAIKKDWIKRGYLFNISK